MRIFAIRPEYVELIPRQLEGGVLYISKRFQTASHLCACGCGTKIVTPLRKAEYRLIEQNGLVTVRPSIGNWDHLCQSHYLITDNRIDWASKLSRKQIERGRTSDDADRDAYFSAVAWPWWRRVFASLKERIDRYFGK